MRGDGDPAEIADVFEYLQRIVRKTKRRFGKPKPEDVTGARGNLGSDYHEHSPRVALQRFSLETIVISDDHVAEPRRLGRINNFGGCPATIRSGRMHVNHP
jgi:hypothetical protein